MLSRSQLRRQMRQRRRALSASQSRQKAQQLAARLAQHPALLRAKKIAVYSAADGEMSLAPLLKILWKRRKHCYLPVLQPLQNSLWFRRYQPDSRIQHNRFKIPEPAQGQQTPPWALDIVLMPLVAFDRQGNRLGMGGGFYDRCFAYQRQRQQRKPRLLGIAYTFQEYPQLPVQDWDVPLWGIATEQGILRPERRA